MKDQTIDTLPRTEPIQSATFSNSVNAEIRRAAQTGIYDIRGGGAKRRVPHFDDLLFLGASISRYPLEGYRETCETKVTLGTRYAKTPIELDIPVTIAGMSFGALSGPAKEALGRGASAAGTSTTTGDGGMTEEGDQHHQQKRILLDPGWGVVEHVAAKDQPAEDDGHDNQRHAGDDAADPDDRVEDTFKRAQALGQFGGIVHCILPKSARDRRGPGASEWVSVRRYSVDWAISTSLRMSGLAAR